MDIDYTFDARGHPDNRACRSDHANYARYGIPIAFFSTGYYIDYHQVTDEAQYIDYEHLARVARFVHDVADQVAAMERRPFVDHPVLNPRLPCRQ